MRYRRSNPRGHTIMEATVALAVLAIGMTGAIQCLRLTTQAQRTASDRTFAVQVAENALERVSAVPIDALDAGSFDQQGIEAEVAQALRDGRVTVRVAPLTDDASSRLINVKVQWTRRDGKSAHPVSLSAIVDQESNAAQIEEGASS